MSWLQLLVAKRLTKKLERWEQKCEEIEVLRDKLHTIRNKYKDRLDNILSKLSDDENLRYGLSCGFITEEEWEEEKSKLKQRR